MEHDGDDDNNDDEYDERHIRNPIKSSELERNGLVRDTSVSLTDFKMLKKCRIYLLRTSQPTESCELSLPVTGLTYIEANQIFQSQNHLRLTDCNSIISDLGHKKRSGHVLH